MKVSVCLFSAFSASEVASTDDFTHLPGMHCAGWGLPGTARSGKSLQECEDMCAGNAECNAFVWVENRNKSCYLKSTCYKPYEDEETYKGIVSGYKNTINPFPSTTAAPGVHYEYHQHKVCHGNKLRALSEVPLKECMSLCSTLDECVGLSYTPDSITTCWLKTKCEDLTYKFQATTLLPKDWTEDYTILSGQKCGDDAFHTEVVVNSDHCLTRCGEFERCRTVTYQPGEDENLCHFLDDALDCGEAEGGFESAVKHPIRPKTPYERAQKIQNDILINMWKGGIHGEKRFMLNVRLRLDVIMHNANIKYDWFKNYRNCAYPEHWNWKNYLQWLKEQEPDRYNRDDPCRAINQLFIGLDRWFTIFTKNCKKDTEAEQYSFKTRQMRKITATRNKIFQKMKCSHFINKYDL